MLSFLRKTRRTLTESGSTRRYIAYAIGEIALVVIGILIALQVNNWNEDRKAGIVEKNALISLKEEFQKNRTDLQEHISWKQNVQSQWDTFLITISNDHLPAEQRAVRRPIASFVNFVISNSMLNSLLTSGKIDDLKNDSLRYMLATWQDVVNDYQQFQEMHRDFVLNGIMPFERDLFPNSNNIRFGFEYSFPSNDHLENLYLQAYADMPYQNILLQNFYWINIQLYEIETLESRMDQIIELLEAEIVANYGS